jgi:hypothetical protein
VKTAPLINLWWFVVVMAALIVLFAAGLHLPRPPVGWRGVLQRVLLVAAAAAVVVLANVALFRHDLHFDVTPARVFTPSAETLRVVQGLTADVGVTYFYQKQDAAGRAAKTMVEILGRTSPHVRVRTVDPDQYPSLASQLGVRGYNVAVLESDGRRLQVMTTDDRDIALGLLRVTRASAKTVCFAVGHGEYDIDNLEYHSHFEGTQTHTHAAESAAAVLGDQHGSGRLRRALDSVGFATRKVTLATTPRVPEECAALVEVSPRTLYTPAESDALGEYLARGGAALLLYDVDFPVEPRLADLLVKIGIRVGEGVIVDPLDHYFTDEQMVAVAKYTRHPITRGVALTFFPGARPLEVGAAEGVTLTPLATSSSDSYLRPLGGAPPVSDRARPGARVLAVAAEGTWPGAPLGATFRLVVVGDGDFASNSFFPYMSNSDLVLAMLAWLVREERAQTMRPPAEVLPTVALTRRQVQAIFLLTVVVVPGMVIAAGGLVWWVRRR